jgi:protein phosphatase
MTVDAHRSFGNTHVVAAPLGGSCGEVVTEIALRVLQQQVEAGRGLRLAVETANRAVIEEAERDITFRGAGCAIAALHIEPVQATIVWAGNVRVYRLRGDELGCLTEDHSLLNDLLRRGSLTPNDAPGFPHGDVMLRALGIALPPSERTEPRATDDLFILASYGAYRLGDSLMATHARRHREAPSTCARAILEDAEANGGRGGAVIVVR